MFGACVGLGVGCVSRVDAVGVACGVPWLFQMVDDDEVVD